MGFREPRSRATLDRGGEERPVAREQPVHGGEVRSSADFRERRMGEVPRIHLPRTIAVCSDIGPPLISASEASVPGGPEASCAMLKGKCRRGGPTSLTTALVHQRVRTASLPIGSPLLSAYPAARGSRNPRSPLSRSGPSFP